MIITNSYLSVNMFNIGQYCFNLQLYLIQPRIMVTMNLT